MKRISLPASQSARKKQANNHELNKVYYNRPNEIIRTHKYIPSIRIDFYTCRAYIRVLMFKFNTSNTVERAHQISSSPLCVSLSLLSVTLIYNGICLHMCFDELQIHWKITFSRCQSKWQKFNFVYQGMHLFGCCCCWLLSFHLFIQRRNTAANHTRTWTLDKWSLHYIPSIWSMRFYMTCYSIISSFHLSRLAWMN